ncbi:MAG: hypothetical protein QNJ81_00350 [Acidimicrobiia bacterium]|nr:hypothetical protein [Acidimicrobiia bacterium]
MTQPTGPVAERLAQTERDLAEIDEQVEQGELDAATAAKLRRRYETERAELLAAAEGGDEPTAEDTSGRLSGRWLLGVGAVLVAIIGIGLWLVASNTEDNSAAEGVAGDVIAGEGVNLDDISNEQMEEVVAQNPDVAPMRLALADRYFAAGDFSNALTHYLYVLDTMQIKDPAALANVGWMTFLSGEAALAASLVEESLQIQPDGGIAFWYLANIRANGLGDAAGAVVPLQRLLEYENLPADIRTAAEQLLADVEADE